jgi:predicted porin
MNKKLTVLALSAAVSAALAAPAAVKADVTIYGMANLAFDYTDDGNFTRFGGNGRTFDGEWRPRVSSYASRLGFKGFEDLGSGLKAIWQIEAEVDMDGDGSLQQGTSSPFFLRNTFAGLESQYGTVLLGKHDTPFKIAVRDLDFFADTLADDRSLTNATSTTNNSGTTFTLSALGWDLRAPDLVAYVSPDLAGFKLLAAFVAGAEEFSNVSTQNDGNAKGNAWSVAGIYKNGPWYGAVAYEVHNLGSDGSGSVAFNNLSSIPGLAGREEHAWRVGLGAEFGPVKIGGFWQGSDDNFGRVFCGRGSDDNCLGHNVWNVGAAYNFGVSALKLQYTGSGDSNLPGPSDAAKQWSAGIDHNLSKRTMVYFLYTKLWNDDGSAFHLASSNSQAGSDPQLPQGFGADPSGFSVGIRHKF